MERTRIDKPLFKYEAVILRKVGDLPDYEYEEVNAVRASSMAEARELASEISYREEYQGVQVDAAKAVRYYLMDAYFYKARTEEYYIEGDCCLSQTLND